MPRTIHESVWDSTASVVENRDCGGVLTAPHHGVGSSLPVRMAGPSQHPQPLDCEIAAVFATPAAVPILPWIALEAPELYALIVLALMRQREAWGQGNLPAG